MLPLPLHFTDPQIFPLPQCTALLTHSREEQASKGQQPNMSKKTMQNSLYPSWIKQSNRRQKASRAGKKKSETHRFPLLGIQQKQQSNCHNIYAEDLVQTTTGIVLATSVTVRHTDTA